MSAKLRPFGFGSLSYDGGFDLGILISHLEGLADEEENNLTSDSGPKAKRLEAVRSALEILNPVLEQEQPS